MFIVHVNYVKPMPEVMRFAPSHRAYAAKQYESGTFLLSGRKIPRTGGVIIALAESRDALEKVLRQDPFWIEEVAIYDIIEVEPVMACSAFSHLVQSSA